MRSLAGILTNNGTAEITNPAARSALSRERSTVTLFEGQIAIASVMLVLEYLSENFKLTSEGGAPTIDATASSDGTLSDSDSPTLRGAASERGGSEHVNDHAGNDGSSHQSVELPGQAVLHAAAESPVAAASTASGASNVNSAASASAVEGADAGAAAHVHGAAPGHASTTSSAGATTSHGDSSTLRDAASENVNDHGNDGLGHQALESPGQAAAHVGAEVADNAAAGHAATITTAGTTISDGKSSALRDADSGYVSGQGNGGLGHQTFESGGHAAGEISLATADDSAVSLASNFSSPALPTAAVDADAGDAAEVHDIAAGPASTSDSPAPRSRTATLRACKARAPSTGMATRSLPRPRPGKFLGPLQATMPALRRMLMVPPPDTRRWMTTPERRTATPRASQARPPSMGMATPTLPRLRPGKFRGLRG